MKTGKQRKLNRKLRRKNRPFTFSHLMTASWNNLFKARFSRRTRDKKFGRTQPQKGLAS